MTRPVVDVAAGALVLRDGSVFEGDVIGAVVPGRICSGEVVFHTGLTGYQEVLTDPSYAGQIVTFTTPHIGNYGTTGDDDESARVFARGVVLREDARLRSNWRSESSLAEFLAARSLMGISGVDTRRLTRILRDGGAMSGAFGTGDEASLLAAARNEVGTAGRNLVAEVTTAHSYDVASTLPGNDVPRVVAYDFGMKRTIVRCLADIAHVTVVPAHTPARDVLAMRPDGVFLSNGPGDPECVDGAVDNIRELLDAGVPTFGICLGHQLLSLALGARTYKLPFGHHGANHPVRDLETGRVEITSQNHNFCVDEKSLGGLADVTHVNLNDNTIEGIRALRGKAFSVQHHPEAGPGPHDSRYLFDRFAAMMAANGTGR
jgi:carbamoyl-phosphate synthase small subunit